MTSSPWGSDSGAAVSVASLSKRFPNGTLALDNVTFDVPEGQVLALIGLSGSGKSTLLRILNGLHRPTGGTARVLGVEVGGARGAQLRDVRRRVGFVFQQFGLVGRATCMENVLMGTLGRVRGPRLGVRTYPVALRREALDQLERVGLASAAFQRADTLSGGQMQRVAIARSLMQHPALLLADEPVASLDPESSAQVLELIGRIAREDSRTVICTLHQVELALGWSDRIVGLQAGRLVLDRPATELSLESVMEVYRRTGGEAPVETAQLQTA